MVALALNPSTQEAEIEEDTGMDVCELKTNLVYIVSPGQPKVPTCQKKKKRVHEIRQVTWLVVLVGVRREGVGGRCYQNILCVHMKFLQRESI